MHILTNPIYAGAYAFGRTGSRVSIEAGRKKLDERMLSRSPMKRWADADEIAQTIAFLASEQSGLITGATIPCDGGLHLT